MVNLFVESVVDVVKKIPPHVIVRIDGHTDKQTGRRTKPVLGKQMKQIFRQLVEGNHRDDSDNPYSERADIHVKVDVLILANLVLVRTCSLK